MELVTVEELFARFPFIERELKWSKEDVRVFFDSKILLGELQGDKLLIDVDSFQNLLGFYRKVQKG